MDPLVYAPRPFQPKVPPPPTRTPPPPQFPPRTFPQVKPYSRVAAPTYEPPQEEEESMDLPEVAPDPYVGSSLVPGLDKATFWPYITNMDATFVMFYDPCELASGLAKIQIRGAASRTTRPMHKYVAVDCSTEQELCAELCICSPPTYQLYSRGSLVNTFPVESIRARDIQNFVETTPVIDNSTPMTCQK